MTLLVEALDVTAKVSGFHALRLIRKSCFVHSIVCELLQPFQQVVQRVSILNFVFGFFRIMQLLSQCSATFTAHFVFVLDLAKKHPAMGPAIPMLRTYSR